MKINTVNGNVILTRPEKEAAEMPNQIELIINENANLLMKNAIQNMAMQSLQDENAEMLFRLANIEMGGI